MGKNGTGSIKRFGGLILVALLTLTFVFAPKADAAYWTCTGTNVWDNPSCWDPAAVPVAGDTVNILNTTASDVTVTYQNTSDPTLATLTLGGTGGTVILNQSQDALSAYYETIGRDYGDGIFNQTGGTNTVTNYLYLGYNAYSKGTYNLSGASTVTLSAYDEYIGFYGTGEFNQTGGANTVSNYLYLGILPASNGTYNLSAGSLSAANEYIGNNGTGVLNQTGGTNTVTNDLYLGVGAGRNGTYNLSGGALDVTGDIVNGAGTGRLNIDGGVLTMVGGGAIGVNTLAVGSASGSTGSHTLAAGSSISANFEHVGYYGNGIFNQTGGTNSVTNRLYLGRYAGSEGTYNLSAGSLSAGREYIGFYGTGEFNQTGGTNSVTNNLYLGGYFAGSNGTYDLSGGDLSATYEYIGYEGTGEFNQSGGTNTVSDTLTIAEQAGSSGTYNLSGGILKAGTVNVNSGGSLNLSDSLLQATKINQGGTMTVNPGSSMIKGDMELLSGSTTSVNGGLTFYGDISGAASLDIGAAGELRGRGFFDVDINNAGVLAAKNGNLVIGGTTLTNSGALKNYVGSNLFVESFVVNHTGSMEVNSGGSIVFDSAVNNVSGQTVNMLGGTLSAPTFTNNLGGTVTGFGTITGDVVNSGFIDFYGATTIVGDLQNNAGGLFQIRNDLTLITGTTVNDGTIHTINGTVVFEGGLVNNGALLFDPATLIFNEDLVVTPDGHLAQTDTAGDTFIFGKDFINQSTQNLLWDTDNTTYQFNGMGTDIDPQYFEVASADIGAVGAGWVDNFDFYMFNIGTSNTYVQLVDDYNNSAAALGGYDEIWGYEALYITDLIISVGSILDLNGFNIYYSGMLDLGGTINYGGGQLIAYTGMGGGGSEPVPEPATIVLLGIGLAGMVAYGVRRRRQLR